MSVTSSTLISQNKSINTFHIEYPKSEWDLRVNGFQIKPNLALTLSKNLYSSPELTLIEMPLLLKQNLSEKLSILAGVKFDYLRNGYNGAEDFGLSTSVGFQYDFSPDAYIQAVFDYQIKPTNNVYHYNYGSPSSFSLRSGFKF